MAIRYSLFEGTPFRNKPEGRPSLSGEARPPSLVSCTSLASQGSGLLSATLHVSWRHAEDNVQSFSGIPTPWVIGSE